MQYVLTPAASLKNPPAREAAPFSLHSNQAPAAPAPPIPAQTRATSQFQRAPDKSPSVAPDLSPPFSPAPPTITPRPKCRPPLEIPTRSPRQNPSSARLLHHARRPPELPPPPTRESAPQFSSGEYIRAFQHQSFFLPPRYPQPARRPCRSPFLPPRRFPQ